MLATSVAIHAITWDDAGEHVMLSVALGDQLPTPYLASIDVDEPEGHAISFDESLFFALSELSVRRYADATRYHHEIGDFVLAFAHGEGLPPLPARLGSTPFAQPPGLPRLVWNHTRRLLFRLGLIKPRIWVHPDYR